MKKILTALLTLTMLFTFVACGEINISAKAFTKIAVSATNENQEISAETKNIKNISGTYKELNGTYHFNISFRLPENPTDYNVHLNKDVQGQNINCTTRNGYVEIEYEGRNPDNWSQYTSIVCKIENVCYCVFVDVSLVGIKTNMQQ